MDPAQEEHYLQLALNNPEMLCSEAPIEILEACSSDAEPTKFLEDFFAAGYTQWCRQKYGFRMPQERVNTVIIWLWLRASRLHTSILLGTEAPDWCKPLFSDEGLDDES